MCFGAAQTEQKDSAWRSEFIRTEGKVIAEQAGQMRQYVRNRIRMPAV